MKNMNRYTPIFLLFMLIFSMLILPAMGAQSREREDALQSFREGNYSESIRITERELARTPGNMDAYAVQGWAFLALGDWAGAVDSAQRGLDVSRYDHRILAIMSEAQYELGNNLSALQYLQDYAAVRPSGNFIDQIYLLMGEIHIRFEEYHAADIAISTALYFEPGNADAWERLGFVREQAGDPNYALEAYRRALELNGNLSQARDAVERLSR